MFVPVHVDLGVRLREGRRAEKWTDLVSKVSSDRREHIFIPPRPRVNEKTRCMREAAHEIDKAVRSNFLQE